MPDITRERPNGIEVQLHPAATPAFAALVALCGEHDLATSDELRDAIASLHGNVLVDLEHCEFLDSSALTVLVGAWRERTSAGERLELVVPPANTQILRTLEVSGLADVLTVHAAAPPA